MVFSSWTEDVGADDDEAVVEGFGLTTTVAVLFVCLVTADDGGDCDDGDSDLMTFSTLSSAAVEVASVDFNGNDDDADDDEVVSDVDVVDDVVLLFVLIVIGERLVFAFAAPPKTAGCFSSEAVVSGEVEPFDSVPLLDVVVVVVSFSEFSLSPDSSALDVSSSDFLFLAWFLARLSLRLLRLRFRIFAFAVKLRDKLRLAMLAAATAPTPPPPPPRFALRRRAFKVNFPRAPIPIRAAKLLLRRFMPAPNMR